ncbi:MAG: hypothetical protein U0840_22835 [Gemmataceae bacterium]
MSRALLAVASLVLVGAPLAAETPEVTLETTRVDGTTYFRVRLAKPARMASLPSTPSGTTNEGRLRVLLQHPRLVSLDTETRHVALSHTLVENTDSARELVFLGVRSGIASTTRLLFCYPVAAAKQVSYPGLVPDHDVATLPLTLNWSKAREVPGLDVQHARSFETYLSHLAQRSSNPHWIQTIRALMSGEKGKVGQPSSPPPSGLEALLGSSGERVYAMTTGGTALTESLALNRALAGADAPKVESRTIPIATLPGIDIDSHPWKKMMGERRPRSEPLARFVPEDHYYFTTHSAGAFLSAWGVLESWGGHLFRAPQVANRDYALRARYEGQLCLPTERLLRHLPPDLLRNLALAGSDLFFQDGTDVTVLFDVSDPAAFCRLHDSHVAEARKQHGALLREGRSDYQGHTIESVTTPRREVSLHRVTVGKVVLCSNSAVAIRHVLDTHAGKRPCLAESLDFQYMRTIFLRDASQEDGFAFLSDPFVRRLVGPATRIKEMRRQQARVSLLLAGEAALAGALRTGTWPTTITQVGKNVGLPASALRDSEEQPLRWDAERRQAVSADYNTLEFTTPLVELPIDRVTEGEEVSYRQFREEYLRLWRRFFDPVGIRFKLSPGPLRVEMYLLPLVNNSAYNGLRRLAGGGTVRFDPTRILPTTLVQFFSRIDANAIPRSIGVGSWLRTTIDNEKIYLDRLAANFIAQDLSQPMEDFRPSEVSVQASMEIVDVKAFTTWWRGLGLMVKPVADSKHRGITIQEEAAAYVEGLRLHHAQVGKTFLLSLCPNLLRRSIDLELDHRKPGEEVEVNTSLYLAPPRGKNAEAAHALLEWVIHKEALASLSNWEMLYLAGVVTPAMSPKERDAAVRRLLGYVPVSPDGAALSFEERLKQPVFARHGSLIRPTYQGKLAPAGGLTQVFGQVRSLRADLRFREDGIHTVLTLEGNPSRR